MLLLAKQFFKCTVNPEGHFTMRTVPFDILRLFIYFVMEAVTNETKIIYYLDDEPIPYRTRIFVDLQTITLADVKSVLVRANCKYFFKSLDADFGYGIHLCCCCHLHFVVTESEHSSPHVSK